MTDNPAGMDQGFAKGGVPWRRPFAG